MNTIPPWKNYSVEYAARLHQRLVAIHPFVDGEGQAARLLMNLALLQSGHLITIIPPVYPLGMHRDSGALPSAHDTFYPVHLPLPD